MSGTTNFPCLCCCGAKGSEGFIEHSDGTGSWGWINCYYCGGTGEMEKWQALRYARGRNLHEWRLSREESLRDAAARLGIRPIDLSQIEAGRQPLHITQEEADAILEAESDRLRASGYVILGNG